MRNDERPHTDWPPRGVLLITPVCHPDTWSMKTILVPTDFLDNARLAFRFAAKIAKATGAGIVVIHAYRIISTDSVLPQSFYDSNVSADCQRCAGPYERI